MKNLLPLFILTILISCQKADQLTYTEKRLVGSWFFTNVDFAPLWSFKKDITNDYFGEILTFNNDFSFSLENTVTNEIFQGVWQVNVITGFNNNANSSEYTEQVIASYENITSGETEQLVWDDFSLSKNRINANNLAKEGSYTFDLKRY